MNRRKHLARTQALLRWQLAQIQALAQLEEFIQHIKSSLEEDIGGTGLAEAYRRYSSALEQG